jgi:hypothetical protein
VLSLVRSAEDTMLTLFNASDETQSAVIRSALLAIQRAWQCDLFGQAGQELPVVEQCVEMTIEARRVSVLKIEITSTN